MISFLMKLPKNTNTIPYFRYFQELTKTDNYSYNELLATENRTERIFMGRSCA
jgi:phosphoenolpyruvate carboxylase